MNKISCYIIDDEPLALQILEAYVLKVAFLELKGSFNSALDASARIKEDKPDLLLLDINMPDLDGLSFIPMLNPKPMIILTTAYDQHALKAYELEVIDYLLKPISFERFYKSVLRVQQLRDVSESDSKETAPKNDSQYLFLKVGHRIQKISIQEILYIEGMKDYLRIHTANDKFMTLMSFAKLEELLPSDNFARIHKSFMVAIDKIAHIEKSRITIGNEVLPISETYSGAFLKKIKIS